MAAAARARAALLPSSSSPLLRLPRRFLSLTSTPYPLYYDLIVHRPADPTPPKSSASDADRQPQPAPDEQPLDRAKRRYLRKRRSRLLPDPDATTTTKPSSSSSSELVELRPEVVDFPRLHAREEALYFHDAFAMPWEKDKHYRMLYRLEKKYFPHQSLDNAFVSADADAAPASASDADRSLVFFDDEKKEGEGEERAVGEKGGDKGEMLERKVEDFFRSLKKGPGQADTKARRPGAEPRQVKREVPREEERPQPYLVTRSTELPPRWDGPAGTVVLIDKPKGDAALLCCIAGSGILTKMCHRQY